MLARIVKTVIGCLFLFSLLLPVVAVELERSVLAGTTISGFSKALNEERTINVYLPDSYSDNNTAFPVLYVLDGQWHYLNAIAVQKSLKSPVAIPEMIVVGVINKNPDRRSWFGPKSEVFQKYLTTELIPYIDKKYRTQETKVLFGWEMSAFFASELLLNAPSLFEGVILSSGGEFEPAKLQSFGNNIQTDKYVYIANSERDVYTIRFGERLATTLAAKKIEKLHWRYEKFNEETHQSTPYLALYKGLKYVFSNYSLPEFTDIQEFKHLGGMDYLKAYFKKRGERFGTDPLIDDKTKNHLIWLSWKQDNFTDFDAFMSEFSDVLSTNRYQSVFWYNNFGEFYLKHLRIERAEAFFIQGIEMFPQSELLHLGLGKVFKMRGANTEAKKYTQIALDLAVKNGIDNVEEYQRQLASIELEGKQ